MSRYALRARSVHAAATNSLGLSVNALAKQAASGITTNSVRYVSVKPRLEPKAR